MQVAFQAIFQRREIKYFLDEPQYLALRSALEEHMVVDAYGKHTICNVYCDTKNYDLFSMSTLKPEFKQKMRLRSYGTPKETDLVFLEVKKKYESIVYKRRVSLPLREAEKAIETGIVPIADNVNAREIEGFLRYHKIEKKVFLAYDRVALYDPTDKALRVTFDTNLRYRTPSQNPDLAAGDHGTPFFSEPRYVCEIKAQDAMPFWMLKILNELRIYPASFSKIGYVYQNHLLDEE
jgi:hypothetical protein